MSGDYYTTGRARARSGQTKIHKKGITSTKSSNTRPSLLRPTSSLNGQRRRPRNAQVRKNQVSYGIRGNTSGQDGFDKSGIRLRRPECKYAPGASKQEIARKFAKENGIPHKAPEGTTHICGQLPTKNNGLVFDHCHKTNTFRGYCCNSCNRSVGVLGDDVQSLLRAVNYLNKKEKLKLVQNEDGTLSIA